MYVKLCVYAIPTPCLNAFLHFHPYIFLNFFENFFCNLFLYFFAWQNIIVMKYIVIHNECVIVQL